jgi:hypothetical protein
MRKILIVLICFALSPDRLLAHHSVAGFFDSSDLVEIEGVIQKVRWRNPHTVFLVDVTEASGEVTTWTVESGALGVLRSRGLAREFVQVGDRVKILGDNSLRSRPEMFARNMLLANGKEVLLTAGSFARFTTSEDVEILEAKFDGNVVSEAIENAAGIFRVWSTNIEERPSSGSRMFPRQLPLTEAAREIRSTYDAGDETLLGCTSWSMPRLMTNPLPMEYVREGDTIVQRFEENDSVRVIHMRPEHTGAPDEPSMFGFSTGRWEGDTLVVETTGVAPERFDNAGTPFSADMHLVERITPTSDGKRLDYRLQVSDPQTFTAPLDVERYWEWRPEIQVGAYACDEDQGFKQSAAGS